MIAPDVNVLVYAYRRDAPDHDAVKAGLGRRLAGAEPVGLLDVVLAGFVRVVTHRRVFEEPTPIRDAVAAAAVYRNTPAAVRLTPSSYVWDTFDRLCLANAVSASDVPDAFIAAACIDAGATLITADTGFGRFPGLRWRHPLDG